MIPDGRPLQLMPAYRAGVLGVAQRGYLHGTWTSTDYQRALRLVERLEIAAYISDTIREAARLGR